MTRHRCEAAIGWLALTAGDALFLWMFLSVASLEVAGNAAMAAGSRQTAERILIFAADWRHGMAGNSPIFMPGFFVLAVAGWYWARAHSLARLVCEGLLALAAGFGLACVATPLGIAVVATAFSRELNLGPPGPAGGVPLWTAVLAGAYTAASWTAFVVASRRALVSRSWRPLTVVPGFFVVLAFSRHWSIDHIAARWGARLVRGDAIALGSLVVIPVIVTMFVKTTRRA